MIENLIQELAFNLEKFGTGAYLLVTLVVLLETIVVVGQFIPGSIFLVLIGFLCYMRVFDFSAMMTSVFLSHLAGEFVNYGLGRYRGRAMFHADSRFFKPRFLEMAQTRFEAGGAKLLITGQFLGFLRPFISLAAGAAHYSIIRFFFAMLVGCFLWAAIPLAIGFFFGASWQKAVGHMKDFSLVLLVAIPLAFFSGWCIQRLLAMSGSLYKFLERLNRLIRGSGWYMRLSGKHPHMFAFMERRTSISRNWGLGASFGFACALAVLGVCMAILWDVQTRDNWYNFDLSMVNLLAQLRTAGADKFFLIITHLGTAPVVTTVVVLAGLTCFFARQHKSLFVIVGSVVLSMLASEGLEVAFQRNRPELTLQAITSHGFSFPSGHATVAFALFGSLYYWLWNHPGVLKVRATLAFALLLAAFLVGFSRVYLGVHYPSDIASGFCLGFAGVLVCGTIATNWARLADVQRRADIAAALILIIYAASAWGYAAMHPIAPPIADASTDVQSNAKTLEAVVPHLPRASTTLLGFPYVPVTLLLTGDPAPVAQFLLTKDWKAVRPADFFSKGMADPVLPAFLKGKPAALTFEQKGDSGRRILRLWRTSVALGEKPVWLGSIVEHRQSKKWRTIDVYRQTPDVDLAAERLANDLKQFTPSVLKGFRPRGLYYWRNVFFTHGGVVALEM